MFPLTNMPPGVFCNILYTAVQMEISERERGRGEREWERGGGIEEKEGRRE